MWSLGYLDQRQMAGAFRMLRSRDLLWSRMVRDDLMANARQSPISWPGTPMALGQFEVEGRTIHLESITKPVFAVGTTTDHVAPWRSVFKLTHLLDTDVDFVLTNGGHNAGIVSEPGHAGRRFRRLAYRHGNPHPDPDVWLTATDEAPGSWWPDWTRWLEAHSGAPTKVSINDHPFDRLSRAPGTYVFQI